MHDTSKYLHGRVAELCCVESIYTQQGPCRKEVWSMKLMRGVKFGILGSRIIIVVQFKQLKR